MAAQKLLMASIAVALVFYGVEAGSEIYELLSRMSAIGSSISDRIQDIKNKDADILILEHSLQQKSEKIAAIQSEIELWQKQAIVDAEQAVKKAHEQAFKLKNQVARLKHDIESQATKMGALEVRDNEAEKLAKELNLKLGTVGAFVTTTVLRALFVFFFTHLLLGLDMPYTDKICYSLELPI